MMPYAQKPMHMGGCGPHHWGPPIRECHKKCQELLVEPATKAAAPADTSGNAVNVNSELNTHILEGMETATYVANTGQAIIGGGCCVQLSVEYMPANPVVSANPATAQQCLVRVAVADSEGCTLTWLKTFQEGYHVKESIITTYPGARLRVTVDNAIARVRWCEIFSC